MGELEYSASLCLSEILFDQWSVTEGMKGVKIYQKKVMVGGGGIRGHEEKLQLIYRFFCTYVIWMELENFLGFLVLLGILLGKFRSLVKLKCVMKKL